MRSAAQLRHRRIPLPQDLTVRVAGPEAAQAVRIGIRAAAAVWRVQAPDVAEHLLQSSKVVQCGVPRLCDKIGAIKTSKQATVGEVSALSRELLVHYARAQDLKPVPGNVKFRCSRRQPMQSMLLPTALCSGLKKRNWEGVPGQEVWRQVLQPFGGVSHHLSGWQCRGTCNDLRRPIAWIRTCW